MGILDVEYVVAQINQHLESHHFIPRDADPTDHQYGIDTSLRFKTGTSRGEVTIQILQEGRKTEFVRILQPDHIVRAKEIIDRTIATHTGGPR